MCWASKSNINVSPALAVSLSEFCESSDKIKSNSYDISRPLIAALYILGFTLLIAIDIDLNLESSKPFR